MNIQLYFLQQIASSIDPAIWLYVLSSSFGPGVSLHPIEQIVNVSWAAGLPVEFEEGSE